MMKKGNKRTAISLLLLCGLLIFAQSCASQKCGCGSDLNRVQKKPVRYR